MKIYALVILFSLGSLFAQGRKPAERYFLLNNGVQLNFTSFDRIGGDTVFFKSGPVQNYLIADSIKGIYVNVPEHIRPGIIILGLLGGGLIGSVIGWGLTPRQNGFLNIPFSSKETATGAITGGAIGLPLGILGGLGSRKKINLRFENSGKEEKLYLLSMALPNGNGF